MGNLKSSLEIAAASLSSRPKELRGPFALVKKLNLKGLRMSNEAHEKGLQAALKEIHDVGMNTDVSEVIKAYLSASNQMIVPREATEEMLFAAWDRAPVEMNDMDDGYYGAAYQDMIAAYPNPFESKQDE